MRLLAQFLPRVCAGGRLLRTDHCFLHYLITVPRIVTTTEYRIIGWMGEFFRSYDSVQYPLNDDVSVNAFSSDSPVAYVVATAGGEDFRYNNKNSGRYLITYEIYFFTIVSYSIQNTPKCMVFYFRSWKCEINVLEWMLTYYADQTYVKAVKLGA